MNEYKLTYHYPEGTPETAYITERTEAAARKLLTKRFGEDVELDDIFPGGRRREPPHLA